jgi:hypothetical protein
VQFMRNDAPLLLDTLVGQICHLATFFQPHFGFVDFLFRQDFGLHRFGHAVEGCADGAGLESRQHRQSIRQIALLDPLQSEGDDGEGLERACDGAEGERTDDGQHDGCNGQQPRDVVPGVKNGARRLSVDGEYEPIPQGKRLSHRQRRQQLGEPCGRLAARFVGGGR